MKHKHFITTLSIIVILSCRMLYAQSSSNASISFTEPYNLAVTTNKTTNLIFPFAIKSVDRGSQDILARQVPGVDNILQVKAGKENFTETNLTVITGDGNLYSFVVNYNSKPQKLTLRINKDTLLVYRPESVRPATPVGNIAGSEADLVSTANTIWKSKNRIARGIHDEKYGMMLRLNTIYVKNDVMYFQLTCKNSSNINYDVDLLRFYIRDRKRSKRTAVQELDIMPICEVGNTAKVKGRTKTSCVFALPKFTVPKAKFLVIEMKEKNGGRDLLLKVHNRQIINARIIKSHD